MDKFEQFGEAMVVLDTLLPPGEAFRKNHIGLNKALMGMEMMKGGDDDGGDDDDDDADDDDGDHDYGRHRYQCLEHGGDGLLVAGRLCVQRQ